MSEIPSGTLAVVSQSGETITFYDSTTWTPTAHIRDLPAEPHELEFDPKRHLLYVSHTYRSGHYLKPGTLSHEISIVDPSTHTVKSTIDIRPSLAPHGLALDPAHDLLYASVEHLSSPATPSDTAGGLIAISLTTHKVIAHYPSSSRPHWFVLTPDGRKAYTCNKHAPFISVLDLNPNHPHDVSSPIVSDPSNLRQIPLEGGTEHPAISPDGQRVYFPTPCLRLGHTPEKSEIVVIDTRSDAVVERFAIPHAALQPLHVTAKGEVLVGKLAGMPKEVSNEHPLTPARLGVLDGVTGRERGDVEVGGLPLTVRSTRDGRLGFVANILPGTVSVVDLEELRVVATLENDVTPRIGKAHHQGAHGLAFIPRG